MQIVSFLEWSVAGNTFLRCKPASSYDIQFSETLAMEGYPNRTICLQNILYLFFLRTYNDI